MRADLTEAFFDWNEERGRSTAFPADATLLDDSLGSGCSRAGLTPTTAQEGEWLERMHAVGVDVARVPLPRDAAARRRLARLLEGGASPGFASVVDATEASLDAAHGAMIEVPGLEVYVAVSTRSPDAWEQQVARGTGGRRGDGARWALLVEDAGAAAPEALTEALVRGVRAGVARVCLAGDDGLTTPAAVRVLLQKARAVVGREVALDFRGESRLGLALVNALTAVESGADRVHTSALGVGARATSAATELVLLNAELLGGRRRGDASALASYCEVAARVLGWEVPINYPLVGRDAFRTATGVHASAIVKALAKGDLALADRIYSGVPARRFGRRQEIGIGFLSGASNVVYYLNEHGIEADDALVATLLHAAKSENHLLSDAEITALIAAARGGR